MNPPYRSSTRVIPFQLFLDIVPSSSADTTHALRIETNTETKAQPQKKAVESAENISGMKPDETKT